MGHDERIEEGPECRSGLRTVFGRSLALREEIVSKTSALESLSAEPCVQEQVIGITNQLTDVEGTREKRV